MWQQILGAMMGNTPGGRILSMMGEQSQLEAQRAQGMQQIMQMIQGTPAKPEQKTLQYPAPIKGKEAHGPPEQKITPAQPAKPPTHELSMSAGPQGTTATAKPIKPTPKHYFPNYEALMTDLVLQKSIRDELTIEDTQQLLQTISGTPLKPEDTLAIRAANDTHKESVARLKKLGLDIDKAQWSAGADIIDNQFPQSSMGVILGKNTEKLRISNVVYELLVRQSVANGDTPDQQLLANLAIEAAEKGVITEEEGRILVTIPSVGQTIQLSPRVGE